MRTKLPIAFVLALLVAAPPATAKDDVPDKRMYLVYRAVGHSFAVDGRIIAAMHFRENTYNVGARKGQFLGPFGFGDNAWGDHGKAYRKGKRPKSYPFQSGRLKRCRDKHPCIHDLFDAAMAAGEFLEANGSDGGIDSRKTKKALCYFNTGVKDKKCEYEELVIEKAKEYRAKRF
jgi:hypothetical protein